MKKKKKKARERPRATNLNMITPGPKPWKHVPKANIYEIPPTLEDNQGTHFGHDDPYPREESHMCSA